MNCKDCNDAIPPLEDIPIATHSVVEKYFELNSDGKHVTDGYAFSKTKKFVALGKPIPINLLPNQNNMLVLLAAKDYSRAAGRRGFCKSSSSMLLL